MLGSVVVYCGLVIGALGAAFVVKPIPRLGIPTRSRGALIALAGLLMAGLGLVLPARKSSVPSVVTRLDEHMPHWQFREVHTIRIAVPPERVFEAITQVRADEIALFRTLTWIRRGGRPLPGTILDPGHRPIIDVALDGGFTRLTFDPPHELVIATPVMGARAVMNFLVEPDSAGGSVVTTETRVYAENSAVRRRFAMYWRVIYPGSALIRRMWLRAIERRLAGTPSGERT